MMIIATIICEVVLIKFPAQLTALDEKLLAQSVIWLDRLLVYSSICGLKICRNILSHDIIDELCQPASDKLEHF